jgi:small subunit ribosomal protein S17
VTEGGEASSQATEGRSVRPTVTGKVVSAKMRDTIVVREERLVKHALYKKYVRRWSRYVAHDAGNSAREGDDVEIMQTRPLSKTKNWRLVRIVRRAPGGVVHADSDVADIAAKADAAGAGAPVGDSAEARP